MLRAIGENPQDGEEVGTALDLVDDDQAGQVLERQLGVIQPPQILGVFQVEVGGTAGPLRGEVGRQRRLPYLPGAEDGDHRMALQQARDRLELAISPDVGPGHDLEI